MALTKVSRGLLTTSIVDNGNATAITIDSNENVGIGTGVAPGINGSGLAIFDALYPRLTFRNNITGDSSASTVGTAAYLVGDNFYLINQEPAGALIFGTATAERMRIDGATGNVGIGSTPSVKLEVNGGADGSVVFSGRSDGGNGNNQRFNLIAFADGGGSGYGGGLKIQTRSSTNVFSDSITVTSASNLGINNPNPAQTLSICNPANPNRNGMEIAIGAGDTSSNTIQNYNRATGAYTPLNIVGSILTFGVGTSAPERMRIDSSGNLLVGKSATGFSTDGVTVFSNGQTNITAQADPVSINRKGSSGSAIDFYINTVVCGSISVTTGSTAYNTSSDYRLKENVVAMTGATERLKQLNPSRFNFIANADTTVDGFLAHEVQDVVPEAITGTKDAVDADGNPDYQGIDQSKLVPLLVATIQELEARLTTLENN